MNVTVVVATYGEREWMELAKERAMPSLEKQTLKPDMVVGFHTDQGTIAEARNTGAAGVNTDYLLFLDADDELHPRFLQAMQKVIDRHGLPNWGAGFFSPQGLAILTPAVSYVRAGKRATPKFHKEGDFKDDNWIVVGTLISTELFNEVGGFGDYPHGFEDWSLWAKCARSGATVIKVPDAIYYAHVNPQSKHRVAWRNRKEQVAMHEKVRRDLWPEEYA